ncbi:zinc metalloprotease HtpX [candidate division KSB3 bacterium]|uniref:Protease HtpX homolog n=1 Tax=candidate division KSB3 bacterium TaxID=2044937 RepID=A0A9D5JXW0_9BACT|nr:zinc metalloprotease HtpX [candidate division KSB3 bacterium]MBD3326258.1 zinc metalloprotease HtpX [candidate division KSB3 bacterium]
MNVMKTAVLMAALAGLLMLLGGLVAGDQGVILAFIIALGMNFFSYWFSDKIVLKMYRAQEVSEHEAPELYRIIRSLTESAGLPMPRVYIIPTDTPNAFATGRNPSHAAVAVTQGILRILDTDELAGVLGHELAHVKNRDILIQTIAATFASAISFLAFMARWGAIFGGVGGDDEEGGGILGLLAAAIVAPIAATLIQLAISRSEEFRADKRGAEISDNPSALASALQKLHRGVQSRPLRATPSHNATAHMFIVTPLTGKGLASLFRTHPPTEERVARLQDLAREWR